MASASAPVPLGFGIADLEALMVEWRIATDAIFARKPDAGSAASTMRNNHTVSSVRADWKTAPHLMPQFDQACRALSVAEIHFLEWIYNYDPSDADRATLAESWKQWYMLISVDFVRCKEFFLRTQWLSVKASRGEEETDAATTATAAATEATTTASIDDNGERKMFVRRLQVIFPLMARAMLCYVECQPRAMRQQAAKRQAQEYRYCIDNMLCVEYGPLATYSCSKLHRALRALATEWPRLCYDDQLQAYVEALMVRSAQLITTPETMAVHDVEHYRQPVDNDNDDDDGGDVGDNQGAFRNGGTGAALVADAIRQQQHQLYVVNDLLINYLAVTFADMLGELVMYGQFEVVDMRPTLDAPSVDELAHQLLERRRHEKAQHREAYEQMVAERAAAAAAGEGEEPPLAAYDDIMQDVEEESEQDFEQIVRALCVDNERQDAMRAWMRGAEDDPSCNKSRRFIIVNYCVWALRPGEIEVFRIDNANRSAAPRDVLRTMRGNTVKDALANTNKRLGVLVKDEMALQERERHQQQRGQEQNSAANNNNNNALQWWPCESLLLQLALYEYCNTGCYIHAQKLELQDYAVVHGQELETRFEELVYSDQPVLVRLFHHFQLAFRGVVYRYDSIVRAFAAWVELMHLLKSRLDGGARRQAPALPHNVDALREKIYAAGRAHAKNRRQRDRRRKAARAHQQHDSAMENNDSSSGGGGGGAASNPHIDALLRLEESMHEI